MAEPYTLSATQAVSLMKKGDLTVEAYATSLLSRISKRDAAVQAWAYLDRDLVIAQARKLDQIPAEKRGPLHGVAVGVKDNILTKDMPTSYNSPIYTKDPAIGTDAACLLTLRASGALILGKTATPEFAAITDGPKTQNPHSQDPIRTPGGSSSGSGAAVADFQVPLALGTQTGGSIIRPGSFNGVFALKPTWGAVSREGCSFYSVTCDTVGFYAREIEDLKLVMDVFEVKDDEEIIAGEKWVLKGKKVAFVKTSVWPKAGEGTRTAWEKAMAILRDEGVSVEEIELPDEFGKVKDWHNQVLAGDGRTSFLGNYQTQKDGLDSFLRGLVENKNNISRKAQLESYDGCARLRPIWDEIASAYDAVLTPSVVDEAPEGTASTGDAAFCSMWTILQCPAINIPGFAGVNGMPIGLTMVGARYQDLHVLRAAGEVGRVFAEKGGFESNILSL